MVFSYSFNVAGLKTKNIFCCCDGFSCFLEDAVCDPVGLPIIGLSKNECTHIFPQHAFHVTVCSYYNSSFWMMYMWN